MASLLYKMGQLEDVAPLFRHVLETRERTLGAEHPSTLISKGTFTTTCLDMTTYYNTLRTARYWWSSTT